MKARLLLLAFLVAAAPAMAQRGDREPPRDFGGKNAGMSKDERQRMREDMRDVYRERGGDRNNRARPPERPPQMSPQEREKLRRDIQDANRDLRR
ncbi:MAG TPA: hypothetical protein VIV54_03715 [Burkholderiales bacterium]